MDPNLRRPRRGPLIVVVVGLVALGASGGGAFTSWSAAGLSPPAGSQAQSLPTCDVATLDVNLTRPPGGTYVRSPVEVGWATSGVAVQTDAGIWYHRAGDGWTQAAEDVPDDGEHVVEDLPDGEYWFYVWVRDEVTDCTAEVWHETSVLLDDTDPAVTVEAPAGVVAGQTAIRWCTQDAHPDTADVHVAPAGTTRWSEIAASVPTPDGCTGIGWSTATVDDGDRWIRVVVRDEAGNQDKAFSDAFTVDNTAPDIGTVSPEDGTTLTTSPTTLTGTAFDAPTGVERVEVALERGDGRAWDAGVQAWLDAPAVNAATGTDVWTFPLPGLPEDDYRATVTVQDGAGNTFRRTVAFAVDLPDPPTDPDDDPVPEPELPGGDGPSDPDPVDPPVPDEPERPTVGPEDVTELPDGRHRFEIPVDDPVVRRIEGILAGDPVGVTVHVAPLAAGTVPDPPDVARVCERFGLSLTRNGSAVDAAVNVTLAAPADCVRDDETAVAFHHEASDGWRALPTEPAGSDGNRSLYDVRVPGFSPFALAARAPQGGAAWAPVVAVLGAFALAAAVGIVVGMARRPARRPRRR